jgi:two-component system, response regulator / RNA-binding antiterminator
VKVLLADDDTDRAQRLVHALAADSGVEVLRLEAGEFLVDAVAAHAPDVVLVDITRPDRDALEGVREVSARDPRPVVLFVDEDDPGFMDEAIRAGVCSYNIASMLPPDVKPILRAAVALFREHQQVRQELRQAETRLLERFTIDRAKAILMRQRRVAEPEAYRWLRRQAMTRGRRIADIARDIVEQQEGGRP